MGNDEKPERRPSRTRVTVGVLAAGAALGLAFLAGDHFGYKKALRDSCVSGNMERTFVEYCESKPSSEERAAYFSDTNALTRETRDVLTELCENDSSYVYPLADEIKQRLD